MIKATETYIKALIDAAHNDKQLYKKLFEAKEFDKPGYNPEMKKCHEQNADLLEDFIKHFGFPLPVDYGIEVFEAAWFIAIHAISRPHLIKQIADLLYKAWQSGKLSGKYYANFYDRIEIYEGRQQLYGTHLYPSPHGWYAANLKEPESVNERRKALGMQTIEEWIQESELEGSGISDVDEASYQKEFDAWCKETGWRK